MAASDEQIQEILRQVATSYPAPIAPIVAQLFDVGSAPKFCGAVKMHRWVFARTLDSDTTELIRMLARMAVVEMNSTMAKLAMELVFNDPHLLPQIPVWEDGESLFARKTSIDELHRFGVEGGNIVESSDCLAGDVETAVDRLIQLDPDGAYDSDESLMIFCATPMVKSLIRACVKSGQKCKVMGLKDHRRSSWVLTGNKPPCGLEIRRPDFPLADVGTRIVVGARFTVWINDPRRAILVAPRQES
jgi:hypothetical protein